MGSKRGDERRSIGMSRSSIVLSVPAVIYRDSALAAAATLLSNGATYVLYVAAAHALGLESGGSFLAIVATIQLLSTIASVVGMSLTLDVATYRSRTAERNIVALVRAILRWWLIASTAMCLCVLLFHRTLDAFFHIADDGVMYFASLALASNALLLLVRAFLQGLGKFAALLRSSGIEAALKIGASVAIVVVPALSIAVASLAAALCIAAVTSLIFIRPFLKYRADVASERIPLLRSSALVIALGGLAMMTFADGIIARHFLPLAESGVYNAVALGGRVLITFLAFLPSVMLSKIDRQRPGDHSLAVNVFGAVIVAGSVAVVIFAAFPRLIIVVVAGPAFESGAPLVAPYGVAAAFLALATVVASYRIARGARWVGPAVAVVAIGETAALLTYHPSAAAVVKVVLAGHVLAVVIASARSIKNPLRRTVLAS